MEKEIHTIITTAANSDIGFFQDPTACGTFFSYERAMDRLEALITQEMETCRYDTEEREDGLWHRYESGSGAAFFVRIEIISSLIEDWDAEGVQR